MGTGTPIPARNDLVSVYPNPIDDCINIEASFQIKEVQFISTGGVVVKQLFNPRSKIHIETLAQGTYILLVKGENDELVRRMIFKE